MRVTSILLRGSLVVLVTALLALSALVVFFPAESVVLGVGPLRPYLDTPLTPAQLGEGGAATDLYLFDPMGIVTGPDGDLYLSDRGRGNQGRVIWRIDQHGMVHHVAGSGSRGRAREGQLAVEADLGSPEGLVFGSDGRLHFVDTRTHRVFRIESNGRLSIVAGVGTKGSGGDGGSADQASLRNPVEAKFDSAGNLFIADVFNHRIRRVDTAGIIETFAGTGETGYGGDGGPAVEAQLWDPWGIVINPLTGRLLIGDGRNHRIREVDETGRIRTIVGTGELGYSGDGGPARAARLDTPQSLGFDCAGRLYIGDEHNHVIRVVDTEGVIRTLLGTGISGFQRTIEGRVGTSVQLNDPEGFLVRCDGSLVVADGDNGRVIELDSAGTVRAVIGRGPILERFRLRGLFDN